MAISRNLQLRNGSAFTCERPESSCYHEDSTSLSIPRHHSQSPAGFETATQPFAGSQLRATTAVPLAALMIFAALLAGGRHPTLTFQPTCVGILWAGMFLSGYLMGGKGRGRFATLWLTAPSGYISWRAFYALTDFAAADSLMLAAILMTGGWAAARCLEWRGLENLPGPTKQTRQGHFSIWDIGFFTTIVACVVHSAPRLESPPILQFAVAVCLLSGLLCSWIACAWAWKDNWDGWSLSALMVVLLASAGCLFLAAPSGWSLIRWLQWGLAGPVNVIAAQATVILATLTLWRWEQDRLVPTSPAIQKKIENEDYGVSESIYLFDTSR